MATDMISVLMKRMDTLAGRQAQLAGSVSAIEKRIDNDMKAAKRETGSRLKALAKEVKDLEKKMRTEPIALRQIYDTWWLRILFIVAMGMMGADPKQILALLLQIK